MEPSFIDTVLDTVDVTMFKTHQSEFQALLSNQHDHPSLRRLLVWDDIKTYEETELLGALMHFLRTHYQGELAKVKRAQHLSYAMKKFYIQKINHIIFKLKKGELVPYESFSTL